MIHPKAKELLDKPVLDRVTIDIDHVKNLPIPLLKAIAMFGYGRVKLFRTPSGTGFRIVIYGKFTPLENIVLRAILEDDPYRLRFAIHRYFISGNVDSLDVAFYYKCNFGKYQGYVEKIPVKEVVPEEVLYKYAEEGDVEGAYNEILKRVSKYVKELKLYTIVIPADKKIIEKLENIIGGKFKLLADPYYEDRIILYIVSSEDVIKKLQDNNIPIITYRVKKTDSKSIELSP